MRYIHNYNFIIYTKILYNSLIIKYLMEKYKKHITILNHKKNTIN